MVQKGYFSRKTREFEPYFIKVKVEKDDNVKVHCNRSKNACRHSFNVRDKVCLYGDGLLVGDKSGIFISVIL